MKKIFFLLLFSITVMTYASLNSVSHESRFPVGFEKTLTSSNKLSNPVFFDISWQEIERLYPQSRSVQQGQGEAQSVFKVIEKHKSWVDSFSNEDIQELPVGVKHNLNNIQYAIGITKATITKDYTKLTVFARARLPQTDKNGNPIELFFGADDVKLSHQGGIIGDAKLVLLGDIHIPFNAGKWMVTLKGGFDYTSGNLDGKTYVTIGCDGVKNLGIEGEVEFSRSVILPIESDGRVNEGKTQITKTFTTENGILTKQVPYRVKGGFAIEALDWNDILVNIKLQPFVLAKKRNNKNYDGNFQFYVNNAVLDFSDLQNDSNVVFPKYYQENGLLLPNEQSWRGVYVNTLEIKLPQEFKTEESISNNTRVSFSGHHLLIDNYGVSGAFSAEGLFPLEKGRTGKQKAWAYSVDSIKVKLASNKLIRAEFVGRIQLPISKPDTNKKNVGLAYKGVISEEEYLLTVSNDSVVDFNLWKAKAQLFPNSSVELKVENGEFKPKAVLNGRLAISANQKENIEAEGQFIEDKKIKDKKLVEFKGIEFQNLVLQSESPVFSVDYMGCKDKVSLGGFPVSISDIGITANETSANLYFDLAVNLMGGNNSFAAETSLAIIGKFEEKKYLQKWQFEKIQLNAINLNADLGAFSMEGKLNLMNDDPEYGDGFAAKLGVKFKSFGDFKIDAKGVFGKKDFRYWQFQAMMDLPGEGIGTTLVNLKGFAGGASYRMKRTGFGSSFSPTGIGYTPDEKFGLGVKALVKFTAIKKETFTGNAGFEILFNQKGGVDFLGLYGQGTFMNVSIPGMDDINGLMSELKKQTDKATKFIDQEKVDNLWVGKNLLAKAEGEFPKIEDEKMAICADLGITYDFVNSVLHGDLKTSINVAGDVVKGGGKAVLHFEPEKWYIYIGTPQERIGLGIGVGALRVNTGGYFMVGSILPDSPPPPAVVSDILGVNQAELNYMRDEKALKSGSGFAFGTDFSIDTGDLQFLMFYARFQAGTGFDIMLRDYGKAKCANTGGKVGINGWYANGKAYAYLEGELGIRVKLFFIKKKITIIKGGAAALLQAKAPNPIWMKGYIGGDLNLLGGLIKGKFRFKVTIGEKCEFVDASPLGGVKIITDVTPSDKANDIDVFKIPQATFSMKVGQPVIIPEDSGDKTYKVILEKFTVLHGDKEIEGKIEWNDTYDRANFVSTDILPPYQELTVKVEVSFKEKIGGVFKTIMVDGKPAKEIEERKFKTGGAPDYIPLHNIVYSYPVVDQRYFLENEYNQGYIQLKRGQDYLFDTENWKSTITYSLNEEKEQIALDYNTGVNRIDYKLPNLKQSSPYEVTIFSTSTGKTETKENVKYKKVDTGKTKDNTINVISKQANSVTKDEGFERLKYKFETSKYTTFKKKINSINTNDRDRFFQVWSSDVIFLTNNMKDHEPFEIAELVGTTYTQEKPLIYVEATLEDDYFKNDINPFIYANYPIAGKYRVNYRDDKMLGTPPKKAVPIFSEYSVQAKEYGSNSFLRTTFPFYYNLALIYKKDWVNLQSQIVNDHIEGIVNKGLLSVLNNDFKSMRYGYYNTKLTYKLPGGKTGTSAVYKFKNGSK